MNEQSSINGRNDDLMEELVNIKESLTKSKEILDEQIKISLLKKQLDETIEKTKNGIEEVTNNSWGFKNEF